MYFWRWIMDDLKTLTEAYKFMNDWHVAQVVMYIVATVIVLSSLFLLLTFIMTLKKNLELKRIMEQRAQEDRRIKIYEETMILNCPEDKNCEYPRCTCEEFNYRAHR